MGEPKHIDITVPLVNENLEENENSKDVINAMLDESSEVHLHIHINSKEMVPTAIALSMSKRHNVRYYATIGDFPGREYIHGYLMSGYFEKVEMI